MKLKKNIKKIFEIGWLRSFKIARYRFQKKMYKSDSDALSFSYQPICLPYDFLKCHFSAIHEHTRACLHNRFLLFGSWHHFEPIDWFVDYLKKDQKNKDIRVSWELSRFTYLPALGVAYNKTGAQMYQDKAVSLVRSWIENNPISSNVNWFNGMEVGIRALNWIIAFGYFEKDLEGHFKTFWIENLAYHKWFIENNWELYDGKTNNHYLTNLVAHLYLCHFFADEKGFEKTWLELLSEIGWQIFDEGSSYEGSTAYHRFVVQLIELAFKLAALKKYTIDAHYQAVLRRMKEFTRWTMINNTTQLQVGDNDSGLVVDPLFVSDEIFLEYGERYYEAFGLYVYRDENWYVSLRHPAYTHRQPKGHFHQDAGHLTIAYRGIPIVADPGTYSYSGDPLMRNLFRSRVMHNMPYQKQELFTGLFDIEVAGGITVNACTVVANGVERRLTIKPCKISIKDTLCSGGWYYWNIVLGPQITLENGVIFFENKPILFFESSLPVTLGKSWYSRAYGQKESVQVLTVGSCSANFVSFSFL